MNITVRKSTERGHVQMGWLESRHTFSFGDYHDPDHMGFRSLRVINEDWIAPATGFPTHGHRNMEIFSYLLDGKLEHADSMGNGRVLEPGRVQVMSAGSGVTHSEKNPGRDATHMLQLWIVPHMRELKPSYTEWTPTPAAEKAAKALILSPDGRDGSAKIHQDAYVWRVLLKKGERLDHVVAPGRGIWLQVAKGSAKLGDVALQQGDGASTDDAGTLALAATSDFEGLLFDLK